MLESHTHTYILHRINLVIQWLCYWSCCGNKSTLSNSGPLVVLLWGTKPDPVKYTPR